MGFTINTTIVPANPVQLLAELTSGDRIAHVTNDGPGRVWLGSSDSISVGHGYVLWPGATFDFDQPDELWAVGLGRAPGIVTVDERR